MTKTEAIYKKFCNEYPLLKGFKGLTYIEYLEKRIIELEYQNLSTLDNIIQSVCIYTNIHIDLFLSNKRYRYLAEARAAYCILARKHTDAILSEIGRKINRDHASVIHHLKTEYPSVMSIVKYIDKEYKSPELKKLTKDQESLITTNILA